MERANPSPLSNALFRAKVVALQGKRLGQDIRTRPLKFEQATEFPPDVLVEVRSALWRETDPREMANELGKVQNLRVAVRYLDGLEVSAGQVFSFWKHVGRTTRRKGFVTGRQIQEGCLIPALGGGICQLTNSLYEAALNSGCQVVERHPHTRRVPGSPTNKPDATVAWNHIDLRFSPKQNIVLRAFLTADELVVQFRGEKKSKRTPLPLLQDKPAKAANSCASCGMEECFRNETISSCATRRAILVDTVWPEYVDLLKQQGIGEDLLFVPLDTRRIDRPNYRWPVSDAASVRAATAVTLLRAWGSRKLAREGPERRQAALKADEVMSRTYAKWLRPDITSLIVYQQFLPFLYRDGHLGGRRFDVLMTRLPLYEMQGRLDSAAVKSPTRNSLSDFRADKWMPEAEKAALRLAERIVTPHAEIAKLFPEKSIVIPWRMPTARKARAGNAIAFPGPAIARKGSEIVRDIAKELDASVVLAGSDLEAQGFWDGVDLRRPGLGEFWLDGVACVVQPAVMEDQPRKLLQALACGVPIIATKECGITERDGLIIAGREDFVDAVRYVLNHAQASQE